jgi:HD-like signal output (HDOD) protein
VTRLGNISDQGRSRRKRTLGHLDLNCPPLPHTLFEALRLVDNQDLAEHARVVRLAENDPLVAVRILRIVNSAYFGFSRTVKDVDRAVRLLGPASVAGIVMGMNVIRLQSTMAGPAGSLFARLIQHSVATARLGDWLLSKLDPTADSRRAFNAGMLHDFGKILLVYNYPKDAGKLYETPEPRTQEEWLAAETALFGCSHVAAGSYAAENLDFPREIRSQLRRKQNGNLALIVEAADAGARALGFAFNEALDWDACTALDVWDRLAASFPFGSRGREDLIELVQSRKEDVESYVLQLLRRRADKTDRPQGPEPSPGGPRRSPDCAA